MIDAMNYKKGIAQYANDATGTGQIKNLKNNAQYERDGLRVYITATKNIKAKTEILVYYGVEYWIEEEELENTKTNKMATAKKAAKKAAPKKAAKKVAVKKAVAPKKAAKKAVAPKKAAPKKAAKKVAPKKAAKKAAPKKAAKKLVPSRLGKSGNKKILASVEFYKPTIKGKGTANTG